jgi:hypothetical protein
MFKFTGLTKIAERAEPGWGAKQMAASRAMRGDIGDKTLSNKLIADSKLVGDRIKGQLVGGGIGLGVGIPAGYAVAKATKNPWAGILTGIGAHAIGATAGQYKAEKKYLADKGINMSRLGFKLKLDDKAKGKYLSDKYTGGGYKS